MINGIVFIWIALAVQSHGLWVPFYDSYEQRWEWVWNMPLDCHSWPPGFTFAGGIVYDAHGCIYPKLNGECDGDFKVEHPDCSKYPPEPMPKFPPRSAAPTENRDGGDR